MRNHNDSFFSFKKIYFINYLLSQNEADKYLVKNFMINPNNKSYKLLIENLHPNFFLIDNNSSLNDIKIEDVRNLANFLKKSTIPSFKKKDITDLIEIVTLDLEKTKFISDKFYSDSKAKNLIQRGSSICLFINCTYLFLCTDAHKGLMSQ